MEEQNFNLRPKKDYHIGNLIPIGIGIFLLIGTFYIFNQYSPASSKMVKVIKLQKEELLKAKESEIKKIGLELERTEESLAGLEKENERLNLEISNLKDSFAKSEIILSQLEKEKKDLTDVLNLTKSELDGLKQTPYAKRLKNEIEALRKSIGTYLKEKRTLNKQISMLNTRFQKAGKDLDVAQKKISSLAFEKANIQKALEEKSKLYRELEERLKDNASVISEKERKILLFQNEIKALLKNLDEKGRELEERKTQVKEFERRLEVTSKALAEKEERSLGFAKDIEVLKNRLNEKDLDLSKLSQANLTLSSQVERLSKDLEDRKQQTLILKDKIDQLVQSLAERDKKELTLKEGIEKTSILLGKLKKRLIEKDLKLNKGESQLSKLKERLEKVTLEKEAFFTELDNIKRQLVTTKDERDRFKKELDSLSDYLQLVTSQLNEAYNINSTLQAKLGGITTTLKTGSSGEKGKRPQVEVILLNADNKENFVSIQEKQIEPTQKSPILQQKMSSDIHYNKGVEAFERKEYKQAAKEFKKAIEYNPDDAESYYNLGIIYDEYLKDRKEAMHYYKKFLELNPDSEDSEKVRQWLRVREVER